MVRWLQLRKQVPLLIISFLLSSIYRTVMRAWTISSPGPEVTSSAYGSKHGLLFLVGHRSNNGSRKENNQRFAVELNASFPFFHMQALAPALVPVAFSHTPCLSQAARTPAVNGMQFGFGVVPSGGVCNSNANAGNQFSSNPPIPSPAINIPPPSGGDRGIIRGCGDCGGCGGCFSCGECGPYPGPSGFCG